LSVYPTIEGIEMKHMKLGISLALVLGVLAIMGGSALAKTSSSGGTGGVVYNAIPSKLPGSVSSQPFEAQQVNEFGDQVVLGATNRHLQSLSVVLVSFGCQSGHWYNNGTNAPIDCVTPVGATFEVPLTFNIYADDGNDVVPDALIASQTKTVNVQYRPSASPKCNDGRWYSKTDHTCYNGFAQTFKANFAGEALTEGIIWSVAFNTSTSGYAPIGTTQTCNTSSGGCGYDSLNVGTFSAANAPYVGTDLDENEAFMCKTPAPLSLDPACFMDTGWTGFRPLGSISATK
jgi:hypothetical protein